MTIGRRPAPTTKKKATTGFDFGVLFAGLALLAFGLIMVLSAGAVRGYNATQDSYYYFSQQLKWAAFGGAGAILMARVPYTFWRRWAGAGIVSSLGLLALVHFTDAGVVVAGSARWLNIAGISVQPSELAKPAVILFYAHILDRYPVKNPKDLLIPVTAVAPILYLVYKQPELGTMLVIASTAAILLLQTELPLKWFVGAVPVLIAAGLYLVRGNGYQWQRILVWLDPWAYQNGPGYQITNAEIAFGSGGLLGVGLGRSLQKYGFLPENHTDTIFAMVGEELGLVGTTTLLLLYIYLIVRGYRIARSCPDRFGRLLAFGLTSSLAVQTVMNLAVVTGVIPVTGITLPLISYGGNSLFITMVELGLLLNISRYRTLTPLAHAERQDGLRPSV